MQAEEVQHDVVATDRLVVPGRPDVDPGRPTGRAQGGPQVTGEERIAPGRRRCDRRRRYPDADPSGPDPALDGGNDAGDGISGRVGQHVELGIC